MTITNRYTDDWVQHWRKDHAAHCAAVAGQIYRGTFGDAWEVCELIESDRDELRQDVRELRAKVRDYTKRADRWMRRAECTRARGDEAWAADQQRWAEQDLRWAEYHENRANALRELLDDFNAFLRMAKRDWYYHGPRNRDHYGASH